MSFLYISLLVLLVILFIELLLRYYLTKYLSDESEFPKSSIKTLQKFKNYDEYLGWEPKPILEASDTGHHRASTFQKENKHTYTINKDGARSQPKLSEYSKKILVETFGGSATFCRDVRDDETFQYYLEKNHGIGPCKNYGVGSYGVDQSYLRAKRRMVGGGVAVLYLPLLSLYRTSCVYKHYATPGNNWAVKPRFLLKGTDLILLNRPFKDRDELADLSKYADFFRKYDNHYEDFREYLITNRWCYIYYFFKNKHALPELLKKIKKSSNNAYIKKISNKIIEVLKKKSNKTTYKEYKRSGKKLIYYSTHEEGKLFAIIAKKFTELAESRGSKAIVIVSPQGFPMNFPDEYNHAVMNLTRLFSEQGVELHDMGKAYFSLDLKQKGKFNTSSTHASPEGNEYIASWLANLILKKAG
ncbi:MAG: hypothetical protein JJU13_03345 [Balneolaceae bacterium]|nr:hypothetical protein [Balneolaceae bacterium]